MGFVGDILNGGKGAGFQAQGPSPAEMAAANENVQAGFKQQQDFVNALRGQNGLANQTSVFGQQQGLANQLQNIGNGVGPNPAQAALNQATAANVANQAAMAAGQRGASANTGLMARQAANQGANIQQQAVGQSATLQAQQQLNALNALQQQQNMMGGMANTQVGQQQTGLSALNQNALNQQANVYGLQGGATAANAEIAKGNTGMQGQIMGGLLQGAGSATAAFAAEGGQVQKMAQGGPISSIGQFLNGMHPHVAMAQGGEVPAMVSPGETYLEPDKVKQVAKGANPLSVGEKIPGKPKHPGNNYANDTVPKTLEEGGIVIPNSIMQRKDAEKKAAEFVRSILAKNKGLK